MKGDEKRKNWDGLGVRGHPRSSKTSPFDISYMTSYTNLIETMLCLVPARFLLSGQFLPREAMLSAVYAVVVCLCVCVCVCLSVTLRYCIETAKRRITQIMPHDNPLTPVFSHQSSRWNSKGNNSCRWGGLKLASFNKKRTITRKRYKI